MFVVRRWLVRVAPPTILLPIMSVLGTMPTSMLCTYLLLGNGTCTATPSPRPQRRPRPSSSPSTMPVRGSTQQVIIAGGKGAVSQEEEVDSGVGMVGLG